MFEFPPEMLALIVSQTDDTTTHILKSVNKQLRAASLEVLNTRLKEKKKHSQIRAQKLINFLYNENDEIPLQFCVSPSVLMQFDEIKSPRDRVGFMLNYTLTAGLLGVNVRTLNDIALVFYRASLRRSHSNPTPPFLPQFFPRFDAAIAQEITKYENLGFVVFFGTRTVDNINKFLVIGLILSFVLLITGMVPSMDMTHISSSVHPMMVWVAVPVVVLSFTSHVIVPSLRSYLNSDVKQLKRALFWGMLIPLVFYICWEFLILSLFPSEGPNGLLAIAKGEHPVAALTDTLQNYLNLPFIAAAVGAFSFCALVTSFLAVNLSLKDFLADGLTIPRTTGGRLFICLLTVIPSLAYALLFPKGFTFAIGYAGVFVAVLYGILPALMVYRGRYVQKLKTPYTTPGGKFGLFVVLAGAFLVIGLQIAATMGCLPH